jgi:nicotinamide-nucleotide amidase
LKPGKTAFRNFETGLPAKSEKFVYVFRLGEQAGITGNGYRRICGSLNLIINDIIVGYEEEETIEFLVGDIKKKGKNLSTAESCTEVKSLRY